MRPPADVHAGLHPAAGTIRNTEPISANTSDPVGQDATVTRSRSAFHQGQASTAARKTGIASELNVDAQPACKADRDGGYPNNQRRIDLEQHGRRVRARPSTAARHTATRRCHLSRRAKGDEKHRDERLRTAAGRLADGGYQKPGGHVCRLQGCRTFSSGSWTNVGMIDAGWSGSQRPVASCWLPHPLWLSQVAERWRPNGRLSPIAAACNTPFT